ncbi:MAG: M20 family metallopeptidase [Nitrospinota bacterium]
MTLDQVKSAVCGNIDKAAPALWAISLDMHRHPETAFQEKRASAAIAQFLEDRGFRVERGVANLPTAFRAKRSAKGRNKPAVSFMAEYDALPRLGHACGHNVIAMASAGAGAALAGTLEPDKGGIQVLGTPAEEGGGGKVIMAKNGLFHRLDANMMMHPSAETRTDVNFLALAELRFRFFGKASHASVAPEKGINALDGVLATFNAISALRQHLPPGDRVHGIITEGGEAPNIVPEKASAWFYVRSLTTEGLENLVRRVSDCARGAARSAGARLRVERNPIGYAPMRVNTALASLFRKNLESLGVFEPDPLPPLAMGSSDVGNASQEAPTIHPEIQMVPPEVSAHTHAFAEAAGGAKGRKTLVLGAKALAMTGVDILLDKEARARVRSEFQFRGGRALKNAPK